MIQEFEYEGDWWLPEEPKQVIRGRLRFTPQEGAVLQLIGSYKELEKIMKTSNLRIIQGFSSEGKKITLYDCLFTHVKASLPGMPVCLLHVAYVLVGKHFERPEDVRFKSLWVRFSYLDDWVNLSGFKMQPPTKERFSVKYKRPEDIHVNVSSDLKVSIRIGIEYPTFSRLQKEVNIKQRAHIGITPTAARPLNEYLETIYHLQNFLALAIMEPVHPLSVEGIPESKKTGIENKETYNSVDISYRLSNIPNPSETPPWDMVFTYKEISRRFGFLLRNWFSKAELLKPINDLFFGTLYNPRMYLTNEFLNLVQAIESYHRRTMRNYDLPKKQHQKRIAEILRAVPEKHEKWLERKLTYSNEPILRKRLMDILNSCPEAINRITKNKEWFISKTVDTRNYLTHFDPERRKRSAENGELYDLTSTLRMILQSCLLKELGFDSKSLERLVLKSIQIRHPLLMHSESG